MSAGRKRCRVSEPWSGWMNCEMEGGLPPAAAARQAAAGTPYSKGDVYRELIHAQAEDPKK